CHIVAQQRTHPPRLCDVLVQRMRLVLGQDDDTQVTGVDDVRQREVDQAVDTAERDGGLGPVEAQQHQPFPLTARENDGEDLFLHTSRIMQEWYRSRHKRSSALTIGGGRTCEWIC